MALLYYKLNRREIEKWNAKKHNSAIYIYLSLHDLTKCSNSDISRFKASPSLVQRAENMFFNSVYFFNARRSYRVIYYTNTGRDDYENTIFSSRWDDETPSTLTLTHTYTCYCVIEKKKEKWMVCFTLTLLTLLI